MTIASGVEVTVDGRADRAVGDRVLTASVRAALSEPARCELLLTGVGGPKLGSRIALAPRGTGKEIFEGEVDDLLIRRGPDGEQTTRVCARDALHGLRFRQETRVLTGVTVAELARLLVDGTGLTVHADEPGPKLAHLVQDRQSDLDLLRGTARRAGLYATVSGSKLRLTTLAGAGEPVKLHYGETLLEAGARLRHGHGASPVTALGWDTETGGPTREVADRPRSARRPDSSGDGPRILVDQAGTSPDELVALAQSALDSATAHAVTVQGVAAGDPDLKPGSRIRVSGLVEGVDGDHTLTEVWHDFTGNGYLTRFSTVPPAPDEPVAGTVLTPARVTGVDDPAGRGRVRVELPTHGGVDAGWLGVVIPGAGGGKGLMILPDVGDTVLVALPHGQAAEGIVLGGLFAGTRPDDTGVEGKSVKRWTLRTPKGQSIVADDGSGTLKLANGDGSVLELAPGRVSVSAHADLTIEAPGRVITLRARAVDFDHAPLPLDGV